MTEEPQQPVVVREFEADSPIDMTVTISSGVVNVRLSDEPGVSVTVRHAPDAASPWVSGLTNLVSMFSGKEAPEDVPGEAVRQTRIEFGAGRLVVRSAQSAQLRGVPVSVTVRAPAGSNVTSRSGAAAVTVAGQAGRVDAATASGAIDIEDTAGGAQLAAGSGAIRLGKAGSGFRARTGSGDIEAAEIAGSSSVFTGSGAVWLGAVDGDVLVRTGTGNVTVANAAAGQLELTTGSGDLRIDVRPGSAAEVDLSSSSGQARSELPLTAQRPADAPRLRVRGRTGSGSAVVALAAV